MAEQRYGHIIVEGDATDLSIAAKATCNMLVEQVTKSARHNGTVGRAPIGSLSSVPLRLPTIYRTGGTARAVHGFYSLAKRANRLRRRANVFAQVASE